MLELKPLLDNRYWYDVPPAEAAKKFPKGIPAECAPLNSMKEACPFPYDPTMTGMEYAPLGMYHCPYCGDMVVAGVRHPDWRDMDHQEEQNAGTKTAPTEG